jgi:hypothetical protein
MREDDHRTRWLLAVVRRAVRCHFGSYRQIWVAVAATYLISVSAVLLIGHWPRSGVFYFVLTAATWTGIGVRQSYELRRRRSEDSR